MKYFCSNPRCNRHKKQPFKTQRALALHTAQSFACCNNVCRNQMQSQETSNRQKIVLQVHDIAHSSNTNPTLINQENIDKNTENDSVNFDIIAADNFEFENHLSISNDEKWTIMLLKILDDMNAPDYAFSQIISWACDARINGFTFQPPAGLKRKHNIAYLRQKIFQSDKLLPKIETVMLPHGPPSEVVTFDFVSQLLALLQNKSLMTADNLAIDINRPLQPFKSKDGCLGEPLSGSVYKAAYPKFVNDPTKDFFVPIIQWIDRTHITGNERFSLKPYMFTPAIFKEECRRRIEFWGYHGFIPKRKDTQAETRLRQTGDNLRNYHAELKAVLSSLQTAAFHLKNVVLPIGPGPNPQMIVNIIPCILCIIQDMQEGDMLCGRYGPHTPEIQRHCRACDIDYDNLDNPQIICKPLFASTMHCIALSGNNHIQKRWSQHQVDNAFIHMPLADPQYGIFGATPVDTMHAFRKGIIESTTCYIIDQLSIGQKAMLDHMALDFQKTHAQSCKNEFPMLSLSSSLTGLSKISASERVGFLFLLVILANIDRGSAIFEAAFSLKQSRKTVQDIIEVLEAMLTFDAWLNQDKYWLLSQTAKSRESAQRSIQTLLHLCKDCFPSHKWSFPKFHEMLHIIRDMERFGATKNFSAQRPESLLIKAAKQPGRRAKKQATGALYDAKAAARVVDSFFINKFYQQCTVNGDSGDEEHVDNGKNQDNSDSITNSTGRGTFGIVQFNTNTNSYNIEWRTKTNTEDMKIPRLLMQFVVTNFGNSVTVCTEFRRDTLILRCHPKFQSHLPKYDWMCVRFETGVFPCRLALVVVRTCEITNTTDYHLIVQSTTSKTDHPHHNGSVLFTEWNWSPEYYCILPENIVSSCFVIMNKDDPSRVLQTLPYSDWAGQFTT